jgi:hypothetical protein
MPETNRFDTLQSAIPDPDTVRALLAQVVQEAQFLRSLLRVAERKVRDRGREVKGGKHDRHP